MKLTKEEIKWLEKVKDNPDKYKIEVDNGDIFISEKVIDINSINENDYEWEFVVSFNDYGQDFIVKLLNTLGYNADWV